jgi:hypothetical protein
LVLVFPDSVFSVIAIRLALRALRLNWIGLRPKKNQKAKGKPQKAKGKNRRSGFLTVDICLLIFFNLREWSRR